MIYFECRKCKCKKLEEEVVAVIESVKNDATSFVYECKKVNENSEGVWLAGEGTFVGEAINQGEPMTFEDENE